MEKSFSWDKVVVCHRSYIIAARDKAAQMFTSDINVVLSLSQLLHYFLSKFTKGIYKKNIGRIGGGGGIEELELENRWP